MITATHQTNRLFIESVLADDAGGYPDRIAFVSRDTQDWEGIVWNSLVDERRPTVIVDEDALEILLVPLERPRLVAWVDRVRRRVPVRVGWRQHDGAHAYEIPVSLSRSRLAALEPGAPAPA